MLRHREVEPTESAAWGALRIAAVYAVIGLIWIFWSDHLVVVVPLDGPVRGLVQTLKGSFYVACTAGLLFVLVRRALERERGLRAGILERERLLARTSALARIGGWAFEVQSRAGQWTDEVARIHELAPSERVTVAEGLAFFEGEDRKRIEAAVTGAVERGEGYDLVLRLKGAKGTWKWVRTIGVPEKDEAGKVVRVEGVLQDVSTEKELELGLREAEERFRSYIAGAPMGIFVLSDEGQILDCNPAGERLLGSTELRGRSVADFALVGERLAGFLPFERLAEEGHLEMEVQVVRVDGRRLWVSARGCRLGPGRLIVYAADIGARRAQEEALKLAKAALMSTREGVVVTDVEERIVELNPAFTRITGFEREEAVGQSVRIVRSGRHGAAFYESMWEELRSQGHWQGEVWNRRKSGEVYPEWLSISEVRGSEGETSHYVGVFSDLSRVKATEEKLAWLAHTDPLTGLPNRAHLISRVELAIEKSRKELVGGAILVLNLDDFTRVNESLGHAEGDRLLHAVGQRLRRIVGPLDWVGRLGADEFLVLVEGGISVVQCHELGRRMIHAVGENLELPGLDGLRLEAQVGIALFPGDGREANGLLQAASAALREAKRAGPGEVRMFTQTLTQAARERLTLEAALRRAVAARELRLVYQPQVELESGRLVGVEALLRWTDPLLGSVSPGVFIPLAEESGLIVEISDQVLEMACEQIKFWEAQGLGGADADGAEKGGWCVAVNVSAREMVQAGLPERVGAVLARFGVNPQRLELELTEGGLVARPEAARSVMVGLREMGVRLAIDDFGTGYSSLAHLKNFPLDRLKIDQQFLRGRAGEAADFRLAAAIVGIGRSLGLEVLAEGVETQEQADFLMREGCGLGQGWLYAKGLTPEEVVAFSRVVGVRGSTSG